MIAASTDCLEEDIDFSFDVWIWEVCVMRNRAILMANSPPVDETTCLYRLPLLFEA